MKSKTIKRPGDDQHLVVLSPLYKREIWSWLNKRFRSRLKQSIITKKEADSLAVAERIQELIRTKLAADGIKDAEDMYQIVVGTTSEEFWCELLNEVGSEEV
jgi:hypothetical protein